MQIYQNVIIRDAQGNYIMPSFYNLGIATTIEQMAERFYQKYGMKSTYFYNVRIFRDNNGNWSHSSETRSPVTTLSDIHQFLIEHEIAYSRKTADLVSCSKPRSRTYEEFAEYFWEVCADIRAIDELDARYEVLKFWRSDLFLILLGDFQKTYAYGGF